MPYLYQDKLEHISYCRSKDGFKDSYLFLVSNDYYIIKLKSEKLVFESYKTPISARDRRMIELLGYWLNDSNLNLDDIYLYIRLKATTNKEFFHWWQKFNFTIEIERTFFFSMFNNIYQYKNI